MSFTISEHHVLKYDEDVMTAYQQEGSRLTSCVEEKMNIIGKSFSVNRLGVVEAVTKTTRHELHQHQNPEHSVRWANMVYYYNSVLMDPDDDDRVLANPKNKYVMTAAMSLGRRKDQTIIDAGLGTAITGENRAGTQALPTAQIVTGSTSGFTLTKWRTAKRIMDENEVPDGDRYLAISAQGLEDLLADTTVTSADFNTVKALVNGDLNTFLGMTVKRLQLLPIGTVATLVRQAMCWHKSAIVAGDAGNYNRIALRRDMHDAWECYAALDIGAVRRWDEGVVAINYLES